jgi:hypothetical protein
MVPLAPDPKRKSHIQKPEDFTETKQWDKFKRQSFVYLEENRWDFPDGETVIRFLISFMTGGLPEKFAANFIDDLTDDLRQRKESARDLGLPAPTRPNWGSIEDFEAILESTFGDQNKKVNAENQLALLWQGTRTAEEYFQEFDQLVRTAGYQRNHDDVLVRYLHEQVKQGIIDKIYSSSHLPYTYIGWRTTIIEIDGLDRRWAEQKKALATQYSHKPTPAASYLKTATEKRTGTGVTYTGQGQKMDIDQAKAKGLCFCCGKPGHMARNCPNKPKFQVRAITTELSKEEKEELAKTLREEGFSGTQQWSWHGWVRNEQTLYHQIDLRLLNNVPLKLCLADPHWLPRDWNSLM